MEEQTKIRRNYLLELTRMITTDVLVTFNRSANIWLTFLQGFQNHGLIACRKRMTGLVKVHANNQHSVHLGSFWLFNINIIDLPTNWLVWNCYQLTSIFLVEGAVHLFLQYFMFKRFGHVGFKDCSNICMFQHQMHWSVITIWLTRQQNQCYCFRISGNREDHVAMALHVNDFFHLCFVSHGLKFDFVPRPHHLLLVDIK